MISEPDSPSPAQPALQPPPEALTGLPLGDLLAFGNQIHTDDSPANLLREVAETLRRVVGSPQVYVRLRHADTDAFEAVAFAGVAQEREARFRAEAVPPTVYQRLLRPEHRVSASFLLSSPSDDPALVDHGPAAATLIVPLRGRGDRLIGVIVISLPAATRTIDPTVVMVVEAIARQAALAVENVRLAERSARLLAKEQLLAALGRDLSSTLELQSMITHTVRRISSAFGSGSLALLEPGETLVIMAAAGLEAPLLGTQVRLGDGILGQVARHGRTYFVNDITNAPFGPPLLAGVAAVLVVPLRSGGQVIGTLSAVANTAHSFTYEDVDLLEAIAAQVGGPITSARLYRQAQSLAQQVQRRADQLAVINSIARTASASLDQAHMLPAVTAAIRAGFGYPQVDLFLIDETTSELVLAASDGLYPLEPLGYRQHLNLGLLGRAAREGQLCAYADAPAEPGFLAVHERAATRSELVAPISASGRLLGVLNLESPDPDAFSEADRHSIETVADILAGALENAHLYRRAQSAAVLEERNRLARELHDSVTQQLFSITLTAKAARTQLERNPQRVAAQIERIQETATAALAEMRALIFQLRPPALRDQGLVAALQQHAQLIAQREDLMIALSVIGDERLARGLEQPLYRIVQEALNNVVKHANARHVQVRLECAAELILICVIDDGAGFDPDDPPAQDRRRLGMLSMRERAAEIGGQMELHSAPGSGTEVRVRVPRGHPPLQ